MATQKAADLSLKFFGDSEFELNPNLLKMSVVEDLDDSGNGTGEFFLEAGVADISLQNKALSISESSIFRPIPLSLPVPEESGKITTGQVRVRTIEVSRVSEYADAKPKEKSGNMLSGFKER
jgi:hypothetical protein